MHYTSERLYSSVVGKLRRVIVDDLDDLDDRMERFLPDLCRFDLLTLSESGAPPSEFVVFNAGETSTRNGYSIVFDDEAARLTMSAYKQHGTEIMIDLEHMSLDDRHPNWLPDAQGWAQLELREGALWAVNVRWTPEGTRRLTNRTQRFTSPAFYSVSVNGDERRQRPTRLTNVALCAMPATDHLPALVAKEKRSMKFTFSVLVRASKTLALKAPASEILRKLAEDVGDAEAAPGKSFMELAEFLGVSIDPGTDPIGFIAALKDGVAAMMAGLEAAPPPPPPAEDAPSEMSAAAKMLCKLTGKGDINDALVEVSDWRQLALKHREESLKLAKEAADLEATKRRSLTARLVVCGAETPATAWADDAKTDPAKHLRVLSVGELEARVLSFEARSGTRAPLTPVASSEHGLSERELTICKETGADPAVYAKNKANREAAQPR